MPSARTQLTQGLTELNKSLSEAAEAENPNQSEIFDLDSAFRYGITGVARFRTSVPPYLVLSHLKPPP